ncbi:MAG: methyl-accepting chemotaxis protein [Victivallaceae bacterium]
MFRFITGSINRKLVLLVMSVTLIPLAMTTFLGLWMTQDALEKQLAAGLDGLRINKAKAVADHLLTAFNDSEFAAAQRRVVGLLTEPNFDPAQTDAALKILSLKGEHSGFIIYSDEKNAPVYALGVNKDEAVKTFPNSKLEDFCKKVVKAGKSKILDYIEYSPVNGPAMFIGTPIVNNGKTVGVFLLLVNISDMDSIMLDSTGLGKTGESIIIGEDGFMRTSCRKRQQEGLPSIMKVKISDKMRDDAFKAESGRSDFMLNSHGVEALVSCSTLDLKKVSNDLNWAIIAEVESQEIEAPVYAIIKNTSIASLSLGLIACLIGYLIARSVSKPLISLTTKVVKLADGDLTVEIENIKRDDEIGILIKSFNRMLFSLRDQTKKIQEGTSELATAIVEISAAVSELAANSTETATAITEISTTMEEVKQTTHVAAEKAAHVSDAADRVSSISESGNKATHEAINGMNHIKEEMMALAENIVKLSGQTQSIGEIILSVNDLAEQSNLLAVNAAIEAAKAGEFGKGFAVVAQEIKSLAEQSKASTRQVAGILNEIQQATSSAVMATERGSKAVEAGVHLSESAGEAISTLAESISESADATSQISASGKQQIIGIDQLAIALDSIRTATDQSLKGVQQLEYASVSMKELAAKLKSLTEQFRTN